MSPAKPADQFTRVLKSLNCDGWWGFTLLMICALLVLAELGGEHARALLRYDRTAVAGRTSRAT